MVSVRQQGEIGQEIRQTSNAVPGTIFEWSVAGHHQSTGPRVEPTGLVRYATSTQQSWPGALTARQFFGRRLLRQHGARYPERGPVHAGIRTRNKLSRPALVRADQVHASSEPPISLAPDQPGSTG